MKASIDMISLLSASQRDTYNPRNMWPFSLSDTSKIKVEIERCGEVKTLAFEYARKKYLGHEKTWKILDAARHSSQIEFNGWKINKIMEDTHGKN